MNKRRTEKQRSIKGTQVNLRSGLDANTSSILKLDEGTPIEIIGSNGKWFEVKLSSGKTGWVFGDYVQARLGNYGPHNGEYKSIAGDDVNLRAGPGRRTDSRAKLYDGNLVEEVETRNREDGKWSRVFTMDGKEGWVLSRYIRSRKNF